MPTYQITGPDGKRYRVTAPSQEAVQDAVRQMFGGAETPGSATAANPAAMPSPVKPKGSPGYQVPGLDTPLNPDGTLAPSPAPLAAAPTAAPAQVSAESDDDILSRYLASAAGGANEFLADAAGFPVDVLNAAPALLNAIPRSPWDMGREDLPPRREFSTFTDNPVGGSEWWKDTALGAAQTVKPDFDPYEPQTAGERMAARTGYEIAGATLPIAGTAASAIGHTASTARRLAFSDNPLARLFAPMTESMAVAPARTAAREMTTAASAGMGAGLFNEMFGNDQFGDNFYSDAAGSLAGGAAASSLGALGGAVRNIGAALTKNPGALDDVARERVADMLIDNSSLMQAMDARSGGTFVDAQQLADAIHGRTPAEEVVPGFRADLADRAKDPGLTSFVYNAQTANPGARHARVAENDAAIMEALGLADPGGNPAQFRADVLAGADSQIADARARVGEAQMAFDDAAAAAQPTLTEGAARGSVLRGALQAAADQAGVQVDELFDRLRELGVDVDVGPLAAAFGRTKGDLSLAEQRFVPAEANIPAALLPDAQEAVPTGLLDASGRPIMRNPPAPDPVGLDEITGVRSALTDRIREATVSMRGPSNQSRILQQFVEGIDNFLASDAVPPEVRALYDQARQTTFDVKNRFARPGTAVGDTLAQAEGGRYRLDDSAVAPRFVPTDTGAVNDFRAAIREVGSSPAARDALADEILDQARRAGLLEKPDQLDKWLSQRGVIASEFPEVADKLRAAGTARRSLTAAERAAADTERRLTTPSRSAVAAFARYGDENGVRAMRAVIQGRPDPAKAVDELLDTAGRTSETLKNARGAFWQVIRDEGKLVAPNAAGGEKFNARAVDQLMRDPRYAAIMDRLWADQPKAKQSVLRLFSALADANLAASGKAPAASGTAQSLTGKFDPALTASSIASRVRSVQRNQMAPGIAVIDVLGTYLRKRSADMASAQVQKMLGNVIENPDLAADLLEAYNPATFAAKNRRMLEVYGQRYTQIFNALDEETKGDQQ